MDKGTMYLGGIVLGLIIAMSIINSWLATFLTPQLVQQIGSGLTLVGMLLSIVILEASFILRTAGYPFIMMIIRPNNEVVEVYFDRDHKQSTKVGENLWSSTLHLKFPRKIKSYGNAVINQFKILHEFEFDQRFQFKPGRASLDEYDFDHANTEFIEVVQIPEKSHSIDHAHVIPEYKLLAARNDYRRTFTSPNQTRNATKETPKDLENYIAKDKYDKALELLSAQKVETEYWHEIGIGMEQQFEGGRTETRGLLGAMNTGTAYAIETMLALIKAFGNVDRALEHLRGTAFDRWGKWVIMGLLAGGVIVYIQLNPGTLNGVYQYFSDPNHQIIIIAFAAVAFIAVYFILRRKKA